MKKRSTAGGRRHFAVLLLFILGMIAVFTCISVTMGAVEIAPVNIVKIIINKSFGVKFLMQHGRQKQKILSGISVSREFCWHLL